MAAASSGPSRAPWPEDAPRLCVGDLAIDLRYRRVERPDGATELPNRMFDLLLVFLARPHVLHTRAALFEQVWSGVVVEDANLSQSVWMLRKALGAERRHWIRTVPGSGYVFEPPAAVEAGGTARVQPAGLHAGAPTLGVASGPVPTPAGRRWLRAGALVLLAGLSTALGAWHLGRGAAAGAPGPAIAVTLVEVGEPSADADLGWPVKLLHAWLGWKLDQLPEVVLLDAADVAADASTPPPLVVLLASGRLAGAADGIFVRAWLASGSGADGFLFERHGTPAQLPGLVDELSRQVVAKLLPAGAGGPWPAMDLDPDAARSYARVHASVKARDWPAVVAGAQPVMQASPGFGLVRLDLAQAQARLGQTAEAREQMALARRLLTPLPDDAVPVMDARELAINPQKSAIAAEAYGALAREYPQRMRFALEQARQLVRSGDAEQALQILDRPGWKRQPTGVRIKRLLALAQAGLLLGDPHHTLANAREAARLAQVAGSGWEHELGSGLMMVAQAQLSLGREDAALVMLDQSARQFEQAGSTYSANHVRYQAELVRSPDAAHSPELDALLRQARTTGQRNLEIELLRMVAYRHYHAGEHHRFRERLDQASEVANAAGNRYWQNRIDLDLLNEDVLLGDLPSARRRIARLRDAPMQGDQSARVAQFDAAVLQLRGLTGPALDALEHHASAAGRRSGFTALPPLTAARAACARADLFLQRGNLPRAQAELAPCNASGHPVLRLQAEVLEARLMQLAGRPAGVLDRLEAVRDGMQALAAQGPDRLWLLLDQAAVLSRAGMPEDARRILGEVRMQAEEAGHGWLLALAETGLAEASAAQGDWNASARHLAAARRHVPEDAWTLARRLELVAAVLSLAGGERDEAIDRLARLDARSHLLGDAPSILEVHSLLPADSRPDSCHEHRNSRKAAPTGLAGANLSWLAGSLPGEAGGRYLQERDALAGR